MSILDYRLVRALLGLAIIIFPSYYMLLPSFNHFVDSFAPHLEEALARGKIEWRDAGSKPGASSTATSIPYITHFFGTEHFDGSFRSAALVFSPSSNGYDPVGRWQFVQFLIDLGPVNLVWALEGLRNGNRWTLAYLPSLWLFLAQYFTLGLVGPVFCFFHFVFGAGAKRLATARQERAIDKSYVPLLLPLILGLHTTVVMLGYFSPDHNSRHWWVWFWQPVPLWIGVANVVLSNTVLRLPGFRALKNHWAFSASTASIVIGLISLASWAQVWSSAPYSLGELFIPPAPLAQRMDMVLMCRELLQLDYLASFSACFAWMACLFLDMYAGSIITGSELAIGVGLLPLATLFFGPGFALLNGWWLREKWLARLDEPILKKKKKSSAASR